MKLFMFAASLRKDSCNKKLIQLAAKLIQEQGHEANLVDYAEFKTPLYDGDLEASEGVPQGALQFVEYLNAADGLILSSPEYNFSTPGTLKNLIDWISRINPIPLRSKYILLLSASPALVGGNRGLWHTRVPLEYCGAFVYPDMFSLASAYNAFNAEGGLNDAGTQKRLQDLLSAFTQYLQKVK